MASEPPQDQPIPPIPPPPMQTTLDGPMSFPASPSLPTPPPLTINDPASPVGRYAPDTKSMPNEARGGLPGGNDEAMKEVVSLLREMRDDLREMKSSIENLGRLG